MLLLHSPTPSYCLRFDYFSMYLSLNQPKILSSFHKSTFYGHFGVYISFMFLEKFHFILVWVPSILTVTEYHSWISLYCYPRDSLCFPPVVVVVVVSISYTSFHLFLALLIHVWKTSSSPIPLEEMNVVEFIGWKWFSFSISMEFLYCLIISSIMVKTILIVDHSNEIYFLCLWKYTKYPLYDLV